ncbi:hypothetical protein BC332_24205 [Capsicum chinense]|nr:hypothetical protein BC332_24205 [Capsicum chinense]
MGLLPRQNWDKVEPKEEASYSFMHAPLGSGDIARLVELRFCNWVVAITGWVVRVGEGQLLILKTSVLKTKESGGKGGKPSVPGSPVVG